VIATLLFGLHQMVKSLPKPEGLTFYVDDVEALAQILVMRMCNCRAVILHDASKEDRERKLQVMLEKLSAGPTSVRDLLSELVTRGQAVDLGGDRYQPASTTWQHTALTLEVR
jgi:hypothetical protein